jgi:probable phosphomutase (TIGR03848 family)
MGGSAAEIPTPPGEQQPVPGLRASDAERDQVVAKLRDEFVAGRLSHDTFLHRVNVVLESRRQAELPPMVADLPAEPARGGRSLAGWLRGTWSRVSGAAANAPQAREAGRARRAGPRTMTQGGRPARPVRAMTTGMAASPDRGRPFMLQFPRGGGDQFSIGRDASCDLAIADMTVSRLHAQLERTPDGWLLSDLESTNGTRVNGWRVRGKVPVGPGDLVSFGSLEVVFAVLFAGQCCSRGDDPPAPPEWKGSAPPSPPYGRTPHKTRRPPRCGAVKALWLRSQGVRRPDAPGLRACRCLVTSVHDLEFLNVTTVLLVRHGLTATTGQLLTGWTPGVGLDERGRAQAKALGERLAPVPLDAIVTSPLDRCRQTVEEIVAARAGRTWPAGSEGPPAAPVTEDRVGECKYGDWTGKPLKELEKDPLWPVVQAHPSAVTFPGPEGESMLDMQHRAVSAIREWNAKLGKDATYLVCSHGDVIKAIVADSLGLHLDQCQRIVADPCSLTVIRYTPLRPFLLRLNDTGGSVDDLLPRPKPADGAESDAVVGGGAGAVVPRGDAPRTPRSQAPPKARKDRTNAGLLL